MLEGDEARQAVAEAGRRTTARRHLERREHFQEVSPEVGVLDESAFDDAFADDPDEALALLADLTGATDEGLRTLARRLAGRVLVDVARTGEQRRRGVGRLRRDRADRAEGDLDLDASLDAIGALRTTGIRPGGARPGIDADELVVRTWHRPETALCLLVDRSGSMAGDRLAAAAVGAASVLFRAPTDCSVVAFAEDAVVVQSQGTARPADEVVGDLLRLRGFGVTNLALALRTAREQLGRSRAGRRIAVLLSDCRATTGGDATPEAATLEELVVVAPHGDSVDAEALADVVGARWTTLDGPSSVPAAFARVLGD